MVTKIPDALSAYQNASKLAGQGSAQTNEASGGNQVGTFAELIKHGVEDAVKVQKTSEEMGAKYIAGKADLQDVVSAVRNAEVTLNTVVALRVRVVNALQEIMRMPI